MIVSEFMFDIEEVGASRLPKVDFDNLPFGRVFSDHMFVMDYKDGTWQKGQIIPFQNLSMNPASSVIHYGQSIFEGMKAFRGNSGDVYLFRPEKNIERFNVSAERMCMPHVDPSTFQEALMQLLNMDQGWVPSNPDAALYIRPFMFATDEYIGVKPSETYRFMIFTCPVGAYYGSEVNVKIETKFVRSAPGGTGYAKAAGNYAGALYPAKMAQEEGYQQLIWTDAAEHKYIEESGTMNVVFRSGNKIISPSTSETILAGITRDSVLTLARDWGYDVEERRVSVAEIIELAKMGALDEAFGAGTAATIAPIRSIAFEGVDYELAPSETWEFANKAKKALNAIKRGEVEDKFNWNLKIS
ncbi:MAG: branched-chain amino acid aminotransferase [Flavobacteriales bacterium]|nr:branched-chain amino acid aminotransferase [Flavobacteriales bacterium]